MSKNKLLEIINQEMQKLNIDYHYLVNDKDEITYPYAVGSYMGTGNSYEAGTHTGILTLNIWHRGSTYELNETVEKISKHFEDFRYSEGRFSCYVSAGEPVDNIETDITLKRKEIDLDITYCES